MSDDGANLAVVLALGMVGIIVLGGIGGIVLGTLDAAAQVGQMSATEQTTGTVTSTFTSFDTSGGAGFLGTAGAVRSQYYGGGNNQKEYVLRIGYHYTVDGETYTAKTPYPENVRESLASGLLGWRGGTEIKTTSLDTAVAYATRFEKRSEVTVHYESASPEDSFLIERYSKSPYFAALAGIMLLAFVAIPFVWLALVPGDGSEASDSEEGQSGTDDSGPGTGVVVGFWGGIALVSLAYPVHYWHVTGEASLWLFGWGVANPAMALLATYAYS